LIAQSIDSLNQETILKSWNKSPYSNSQNKWLKKNGFKAQSYNWDNKEISLYLNKSLDQKNGAKLASRFGVASMIGGLYSYFGSLAVQDAQKSKNAESTANKFFIVSGSLFTTSIILNGASLRNLGIAKRLKARDDF
jgi:hypothetical protein